MKFIINALLCKIVFHNLILMHIFSIHIVFIATQWVQNQNTLLNYLKLRIEMSYRMLIIILKLQYQNTKLLILVQCWIHIYFFFSGRDMCGSRGRVPRESLLFFTIEITSSGGGFYQKFWGNYLFGHTDSLKKDNYILYYWKTLQNTCFIHIFIVLLFHS